LLTHLHQNRRAQHGKPPHGVSSNSKLLVYPKPPRPSAASEVSSTSSLGSTHPGIGGRETSKPNVSQFDAPNPSSPSSFTARGRQAAVTPITNCGMRFVRNMDLATDIYPAAEGSCGGRRPYYSTTALVQEKGSRSPLQRVRTSLEMLSHLCEQSGWKWVDGLLLGGCLHYGLERYDEALDWFSRIVSLDRRYVSTFNSSKLPAGF
jgi:hypothetical protein